MSTPLVTGPNGAQLSEGDSPKGVALLQGNAADGTSGVGVILDNQKALANASAVAVSIRQNGTTVLDIMALGGKLKPATIATAKAAGSASCGSCALDTSGTVTVSTTAVTANSLIFLVRTVAGGTAGTLYAALAADITPGTSFIIRSYSSGTTAATSDTSTVAWFIVG